MQAAIPLPTQLWAAVGCLVVVVVVVVVRLVVVVPMLVVVVVLVMVMLELDWISSSEVEHPGVAPWRTRLASQGAA